MVWKVYKELWPVALLIELLSNTPEGVGLIPGQGLGHIPGFQGESWLG